MNNKIVKIISKILLAISFIFIALKLRTFNINLKVYFNFKNILMLSGSIILLSFSVVVLSIGWNKILNKLTKIDIKYTDTMSIYIKTNLAKYIPGNVMQFLGRNLLGNQYGMEQKNLTLSTIYELAILAFIGFTMILVTNQIESIIRFIPKNYILMIIVLGLILFIITLILYAKGKIKLSKIELIDVIKVFKASAIYYLIALIFMGISFVIVMLTVYEHNANIINMISWIGIFILGWFIGFITPGAPGGVGIREAILLAYMNKIIPSQFILEAILIHRVITIISDIIIYIVWIIFNWKGRNRMNIEQPQGNYYDKYGSNNRIVVKLMNGFFSALDECLKSIKFNNVVEAGCGEGKITNYICKNFNCNIEGFDIGEEAINKAKASFKNLKFEVKSIYDLEYKENSFDLVVCCEVLEHLDQYERALDELIRISNKYVLVSVPREPVWRVLNLVRFKYVGNLGNTPGHINHWSKKKFINLLNGYGNIKKIKSPLPWTMILLEKDNS